MFILHSPSKIPLSDCDSSVLISSPVPEISWTKHTDKKLKISFTLFSFKYIIIFYFDIETRHFDFFYLYRCFQSCCMSTDEPGKPGRPEPRNWDKDFVELEWSPPKDDGGAPITGYIVQKREKGGRYSYLRLLVALARTVVFIDKRNDEVICSMTAIHNNTAEYGSNTLRFLHYIKSGLPIGIGRNYNSRWDTISTSLMSALYLFSYMPSNISQTY